MRRKFLKTLALTVAFAFLPICVNGAASQEAKTETTAKESATAKTPSPHAVYRLEYSIRELEDGKRINTRSYTMMAQENDWARVRVGNRVPIVTGGGQTQYQDVGMNIDCRVHGQDDYVLVDSTIESSSVASGAGSGTPVFRRVSTTVSAAVTLGKPTIIGSMDDVTSNRRYEIEVTVTKVK